MVTPPRKFFEDYVRRSFEEFRAEPDSEYRAKRAVAEANNMAERMLHQYNGTDRVYGFSVKEASRYRDMLAAKECADFGVVRDVAESHKHFRLDRRENTRQVSSAEQTGARPIRVVDDAGQPVAFVNTAGEEVTVISDVVVDLDDGSCRPLLPMLEAVVAMWDRLLAP